MEINTQSHSIMDLFENHKMFKIPRYQRSYSWEKNQIDDFLNDIELNYNIRKNGKNDENHFFGGVVSIENKELEGPTNSYEIVDGQQRLTTVIIFIRALINKYEEIVESEELNGEIKETIPDQVNDLKKLFISYEKRVGTSRKSFHRLYAREKDLEFFKDFMDNGKFGYHDGDKSKLRMKENYEMIINKINFLLENKNINEKANSLFLLEDVIKEDFIVIHIIAQSKNAAYRLFRVLNDRGLNLSAGDLIKSEIMEKFLEDKGKQASIEKKWDLVLNESRDEVEDVLQSIYVSLTGKRAKKDNLHTSFIENVFIDSTYEKISELTDEILRCKELIEKLKMGNLPSNIYPQSKLWEKNRIHILIKELGCTSCIPLLVSASLLNPELSN